MPQSIRRARKEEVGRWRKASYIAISNGVDNGMDNRNMSRVDSCCLRLTQAGTTAWCSETRHGPCRWHLLTITDTYMSALAEDGSSDLRNRGLQVRILPGVLDGLSNRHRRRRSPCFLGCLPIRWNRTNSRWGSSGAAEQNHCSRTPNVSCSRSSTPGRICRRLCRERLSRWLANRRTLADQRGTVP